MTKKLTKSNFSYNLRLLREHYDLTRDEFAESIKATPDQLYGWEEKNRRPPIIYLDRISELYRVNIDDLDKKQLTTAVLKELIEEKEKSHDEEVSMVTDSDNPLYSKSKNKRQVDSSSYTVHSLLRIEAMLRVLLRSTAESLAAQREESVTKVLGELTRAVKDEISIEFEGL